MFPISARPNGDHHRPRYAPLTCVIEFKHVSHSSYIPILSTTCPGPAAAQTFSFTTQRSGSTCLHVSHDEHCWSGFFQNFYFLLPFYLPYTKLQFKPKKSPYRCYSIICRRIKCYSPSCPAKCVICVRCFHFLCCFTLVCIIFIGYIYICISI